MTGQEINRDLERALCCVGRAWLDRGPFRELYQNINNLSILETLRRQALKCRCPMGGWKKGTFVFGGYHGNWDVATVADGGGETSFLTDHAQDDKPSGWWVP
jgi:hypothetical protein